MRKIKIDKALVVEVDTFCNNLFTNRRQDFVQPLVNLENLRNRITKLKHKCYKNYVQEIIDNYSGLLRATPTKMRDFINQFNKKFPNVVLNKNITSKKRSFYETIVDAMRYEDLREEEFVEYLQNKSMKACVYCNANSTLIVESRTYRYKPRKNSIKKARLELDHFHPKSRYPFLCTSFFNLYPVCGYCNRLKSSKEANFELYTEEDDLEVFEFWIEDESIVNYWNNRNGGCKQLKVWLQANNGDVKLLQEHNEMFHVQGVTNCNLDIAEELIHKAIVYTDSYKKSLVYSFKALFPDQTIINRLLIGNYDRPEDVHSRPMAKMTQDIARQLGLI